MDIISAIVLYVSIWWLLLFAVLPFGNAPDAHVQSGHATSAPANPRIKQKFLITTGLAFVIWTIIAATIHYTHFSFYDWVYNWE